MAKIHAIFPSADAGRAAIASLRAEGLADDAAHRPEVHADRLYHTPHAGQSAIAMWFLGGALVCGGGAAVLGFVLASTGSLGLPVPPAAAATFWFLAGGALGGLSAALGGAGAFKGHYYAASRNLHEGEVLVSLDIPWNAADQVEQLLDTAGASSVIRHAA